MSNLRPILLVEDNPKDLELTLAALEKCQLANDIVTARDGEEALAYLYSQGPFADRPDGDPAVVLLDLKLPKIDGLEVLEKVKGDASLRHVPVVMLTANALPEHVDAARLAGADRHLAKPINAALLLTTLAELADEAEGARADAA